MACGRGSPSWPSTPPPLKIMTIFRSQTNANFLLKGYCKYFGCCQDCWRNLLWFPCSGYNIFSTCGAYSFQEFSASFYQTCWQYDSWQVLSWLLKLRKHLLRCFSFLWQQFSGDFREKEVELTVMSALTVLIQLCSFCQIDPWADLRTCI